MTNLLLRTTSILLSASLLPVSAFAYNISHFKIESLKKVDPQEVERRDEDEQRIILDTECREQLGVQGGDLQGALRFNVNRCVNMKIRQANLLAKQQSALDRKQLDDARRIESTNARQQLTNTFNRWNMQKSSQARIKQSQTLPQTLKAQQQSFQSVRASNRRSVLEKENAIRREEQKRTESTREARLFCSSLRSLERMECIREKIIELMGEE
ncbi:hypothetical protein KKF03_04770 [Patescibacteria group bacterium]|nr:hypothetical protein [Patescibacteria group bacterium]